MARTLKIHKPNAQEIRRLEYVLETTSDPQIQRRAEVLLDWAVGLDGLEIAEAVHAHANTVYADLHAFARQGLACLEPLPKGGAPARLTTAQREEIGRLAECAPSEFGLPEGRWSLAHFRDFLVQKRRLLRAISVEHLRRVLKKKAFGSDASNANWSAMTPSGVPFWPVFAVCFASSRPTGCCCSSTSSP